MKSPANTTIGMPPNFPLLPVSLRIFNLLSIFRNVCSLENEISSIITINVSFHSSIFSVEIFLFKAQAEWTVSPNMFTAAARVNAVTVMVLLLNLIPTFEQSLLQYASTVLITLLLPVPPGPDKNAINYPG